MPATSREPRRDYDVVVVGDLNIDLILSGLPRLPQFGEEILARDVVRRIGGSAANFAVCCARLGLRVAFVANVGCDDFGDFLVRQLQQWGVDDAHVGRDPELATGLTVSLSGDVDRAFVTYVGTIDSLTAEDVPRELLSRCRHLHIASYFLQTRLQPGCQELAEAAHEAGASVSLDTGYDPSEEWDGDLLDLLPVVDVFMPNEVEAQQITATETVDAAFAALCGMTPLVVVKTGPDGALASGDGETVQVPAFPTDVMDTTCCGDAFDAGFISGLLAGRPLRESVALGNACGGLMASVKGNEAQVLDCAAVEALVAGACATLEGQA
ncbi:MAG: carbohydrate kinase family protein [candidate division WS1 bacterium]|nr:carbohydrate kinase family protein [candidate division WS1 bacterium]